MLTTGWVLGTGESWEEGGCVRRELRSEIAAVKHSKISITWKHFYGIMGYSFWCHFSKVAPELQSEV